MFGLTDLDTTREQRRWQERRLRVAAVAVGVLSLGVAIFSGSIAAWTLKRRAEATRMLQSGSTGPDVRLSVGVPRR